MGCITSGMVQTSPQSSQNKVEPVLLRTDKVSRGVARGQRQKDIAKHHSEAYNKAKSLSDRVLAEKETLSTTSSVRSSWSKDTAPTIHTHSATDDGRSCKVIINSTNNDKGQCTTKSVHFDEEDPGAGENQRDSGHFSDIPGLLADADPKDEEVTMAIKRAPTPSHLKQQTDVDDAIHSSDEGEKAGNVNECTTQADEADGNGTKQLSDEQNHQGHSDNVSTVAMETTEDISGNNNISIDEPKHESVSNIITNDDDTLQEDNSLRTSTEIKSSDTPTKQDVELADEHIRDDVS